MKCDGCERDTSPLKKVGNAWVCLTCAAKAEKDGGE